VTTGGLVWGLFGASDEGRSEGKEKSAEGEAGKGDDEPSDWLCVLIVYTPIEAQLAAARIEDEGIPVRIRPEAASTTLPVSAGILSRIYLYVPESMFEKAEQIINATMDFGVEEADENET